MMIGVSMAAAIIICIAAFIWLYVQIGPLFSDFIPEETTEEGEPGTTNIIGAPGMTPTAGEGNEDELALDEIEPESVETSESVDEEGENEEDAVGGESDPPDGVNAEDEPEPTEAAWQPTHQIRQGPNVNFRSGPNTISQPQGALAPGTPLQFLGDEEPTGGVTWMYFEIQSGTQGWIRDIDVIEVQPAGGDTESE